MSKLLDEHFDKLNELMRRVSGALSPFDSNDMAWLQKKEIRDRLYGSHPGCFYQMTSNYGPPIPFFCVCNRMGVQDPKVMDFTMKLIDKMKGSDRYNKDDLDAVYIKIKRKHNTYNRDIPKPPREAALKGVQTKSLNSVKNYLNNIR